MKTIRITTLVGMILTLTASGCFGTDKDENLPGYSPRDALIDSLDSKATRFVAGMNQVVLQGAFIKGLGLQNPPEPIPMESEDEVKKGISYLLWNSQDGGNNVVTYTPDTRFCTEVAAKNHPATCIQAMAQVSFVQTVSSNDSGTLEVRYGGFKPFMLTYSAGQVDVAADLGEVRKTLAEISALEKQNGGQGMDDLPATINGKVTGSIAASGASAATVSVSINQAIHVEGQTQQGGQILVDVPAAGTVASLTLDPASASGSLTLNVPALSAHFPINDSNHVEHPAVLAFPGLSGTFALDNASSKLAAQAMQLLGNHVTLDIDGARAIDATAAGALSAEATSGNSGAQIHFSAQFGGSVDVTQTVAPGMIDKTGMLTLSIAAGTTVQAFESADQVKVLAGQIQLTGTGDFNGMMDAQAGSCVEGDKNAPQFLQTAACTF